jgi:hypothetical protein
MQLTGLHKLWLDINRIYSWGMSRRALHSILRLSSISSLGITAFEMRQLPDTIGQPCAACTWAVTAACSSCRAPPASWRPSGAWT